MLTLLLSPRNGVAIVSVTAAEGLHKGQGAARPQAEIIKSECLVEAYDREKKVCVNSRFFSFLKPDDL